MSDQWTNVPDIYSQLEIKKYKCSLWHRHRHDATVDLPYATDMMSFLESRESYNQSDKIFVIGQECHNFKLLHKDPRIHIWEPVVFTTYPRAHFNPFWLDHTLDIEKIANIIPKLTDPEHNPPPKYFDCLVGYTEFRPHKKFVADYVRDNNLEDKMIFSVYQKDVPWIPGHDFDDVGSIKKSTVTIEYENKIKAALSLFIPYKLYNQSWFSIVPETQHGRGFITEKTAKPLLSRRLFIMFSGANHLAGLRKLGFKTFGNILDESYDSIADNTKRWTKAMEQVQYLLTQNPLEIYKKALPALIHNQSLMLNTNWNEMLHQSIINVAKE
jgi:hypothetical protein